MMDTDAAVTKPGIVVIGRNEGDRLRRCLQSVIHHVDHVVYVDSGSTDQSVTLARQLGAQVVELDLSVPFTAARARNQGFYELMRVAPDLEYVQFIDGDCEIQPGWLNAASSFLSGNADFAVVAGRRRERFPERSIFNRMCDEEWNTPVGETLACGGDAMMRTQALQLVRGYRDNLIAGEEPELCLRLREQGFRIMRLDVEMTAHDANMLHFSQWWKRTQRAGHAYAEGTSLHGWKPERHYARETLRGIGWGIVLPLLILVLSIAISPWLGLMLALIYPLQIVRLALRNQPSGQRWSHATYLMLGKFAEAQGILQFLLRKLLNRSSTLIEYK